MARDGWFDGEGFDLRQRSVEDTAGRLRSFGADAVYTQDEWTQQRKRVLGRLQEIEGALDDETHAAMSQVLYEYEVLLFMSQHVDGALKWSDTKGQLSLF